MKLRFLGFTAWFLFCYLFLVLIKLLLAGSLERFFFHYDAPYYMFADCLIGAGLITSLKRKFNLLSENSASVSRDFLILIAAIPFLALITTLWDVVVIEKLYFGKNHTYFNWAVEYLIKLIVQIVVGFSCISYFYVEVVNKTKERLAAAQRAQSEMRLKLLQQQVDPHFLFNNLNVLSALIEKNPKTANEFLTRLAELYRYILQTQNVEVVPVKDELDFAENYLYLLRERFGAAYNFDWQIPAAKINGQMTVPSAVQGLLENVVKHNAGNQKEPLQVRIRLGEDFLTVENESRPKSKARLTSGTGLQNLTARYAFLTEKPVVISNDENIFRVELPLLKLKR